MIRQEYDPNASCEDCGEVFPDGMNGLCTVCEEKEIKRRERSGETWDGKATKRHKIQPEHPTVSRKFRREDPSSEVP